LDRCEGGREKCKKEKGTWLSVLCRRCPKYKVRPSLYVLRLMDLRLLRLGGYPFEAGTLSLDTWRDLGILETVLEAKRPRLF
jgi:hypothetical protein